MLITFEGLDASGKTTQVNKLKNYIEEIGLSVIVYREPGSTDVSEGIRDVLLNTSYIGMDEYAEMFLFQAARSHFVRNQLIPSLSSLDVVILDRFYDSTLAYQGYGHMLDCGLGELKDICLIAACGVVPNITFLLDITVEESFKRMRISGKRKNRMEMYNTAFYERVRIGYKLMASGVMGDPTDRWFSMNGEDEEDKIAAGISLRFMKKYGELH